MMAMALRIAAMAVLARLIFRMRSRRYDQDGARGNE